MPSKYDENTKARAVRLAAVIWHNWKINSPVKRSLIAYDH